MQQLNLSLWPLRIGLQSKQFFYFCRMPGDDFGLPAIRSSKIVYACVTALFYLPFNETFEKCKLPIENSAAQVCLVQHRGLGMVRLGKSGWSALFLKFANPGL